MEWIAEYVELESGNIPFIEFLKELDDDSKIDIIATIDEILERKKNNLPVPSSKSKYLRNKILEMRVRHKNKITRSLYFFSEGKKIVFTHGFIKKSEKTPISEIEKAERIRDYYFSHKDK